MSTHVALFTEAEAKARWSTALVDQVYDDDRNGTTDTSPLAMAIDDASSYVLERYYGVTEVVPVVGSIPKSLRRLALDVFGAYMAQRDPDRVRSDPETVFARVRREIADLREGRSVVVEAATDPTANHGGEVVTNDVDAATQTPPRFAFVTGTGLF